MTKKDYELIASQIKSFKNNQSDTELEDYAANEIALRLAAQFEIVNPKFDRNKFLQTCGIWEPNVDDDSGSEIPESDVRYR